MLGSGVWPMAADAMSKEVTNAAVHTTPCRRLNPGKIVLLTGRRDVHEVTNAPSAPARGPTGDAWVLRIVTVTSPRRAGIPLGGGILLEPTGLHRLLLPEDLHDHR